MKNIGNSTKMRIDRVRSVDIGRGFAILCMIAAHFGISFWIINRYGEIFAAPFFLLISGISYEFFINSRLQKNVYHRSIFLESFSRSFFIYLLPLVPYFVVCLLYPEKFTFYLIHWGVFQVIAIGYILGFFIYESWKIKVGAIITVFFITTLIQTYFSYYFRFLLSDFSPILPWIAYFFAGQLIYEVYKKPSLPSSKLLFVSFIACIFSFVFFKFSNIPFDYSFRNQFSLFLLILSIFFIIQLFFIILVDRLHKCEKILNPLERIGKIAFSAYYIHFLLVFLAGKIIIQYNFPSFFIFPSILVIILILAGIEKYWEKYNLIFSLEWFLRKGSNMLFYLLTNKIQIQ
jgi:hypothetical protein